MTQRKKDLILFGLLAVCACAVAVALAAVSGAAGVGIDPKFATPQASLQSYVEAVLAVDLEGEMACATPENQAMMLRQRGPDLEVRRRLLAGKAAVFRESPISKPLKVQTWGARAKILVEQGGPVQMPTRYVYSFRLERDGWKISRIEKTSELRW